MALAAPILSGMLLAECGGKGLLGTNMPSFCQAFSDGFITGFLSLNTVTTTDTGVITLGTGVGKVSGLVSPVLTGLIVSQCAGKGLIGPNLPQFADALSKAIVNHITALGIVNTTHPGIALGSGIGSVQGIEGSALGAIIFAKLISVGITSLQTKDFIDAFATAFATHMKTAIVTVSILGVPAPLALGAPIPGVSSGFGKIT